jgi:ribosomal protein L21E
MLWDYRSTSRVPKNVSPYELAFGMDVVTPVETLLQSPQVMHYDEVDNAEGKYVVVELVQERREILRRMVEYQRKMKLTFDRRVSPKYFQSGDLVLRRVEATGKKVDKLDQKWEGPFRVVRGFNERAFKLEIADGDPIPRA